ncbi:MAG: hypothetical protein KF709_11765 [Gemmatimonadaceae bacterium]|nr:hypothetical protein [Gemmatimonadaceae bacterium]
MTSWNELLRFTRAHQGELTLSVYIASAPADPGERQSWLVMLRNELNAISDGMEDSPAEEREAFGRCVAKLFEQLPAQGTMPRDHSWAFFAAAGGDDLALSLPRGVETSVHWGLGARVVPFLRVAEPEEALVVQVDRQGARLSRFAYGEFGEPVLLEAEEVDEVGPHMSAPSRTGFHGGTRGTPGADEAQRQRREATDRLHSSVVRRVAAMAELRMPILIGGAPDAAVHVLEALPAATRERAILAPDLRMGAPRDYLDEIRAALHALHARQQEERVTALRDLALAGGKAAIGYPVAERAAQMGAIAELIFSTEAWRQHPLEIESLVRRALVDGAEVEVLEPTVAAAMDGTADGIITGLRFPLEALP